MFVWFSDSSVCERRMKVRTAGRKVKIMTAYKPEIDGRSHLTDSLLRLSTISSGAKFSQIETMIGSQLVKKLAHVPRLLPQQPRSRPTHQRSQQCHPSYDSSARRCFPPPHNDDRGAFAEAFRRRRDGRTVERTSGSRSQSPRDERAPTAAWRRCCPSRRLWRATQCTGRWRNGRQGEWSVRLWVTSVW
jgi:hypothetical protein